MLLHPPIHFFGDPGHRTWPVIVSAWFIVGCTGPADVDSDSAPSSSSDDADLDDESKDDGPSDDSSDSSGDEASDDTPSLDCSSSDVFAGRVPMRRLTKTEYNNTIRDLLGDDSHVADGFPLDEKYGKFANNSVAAIATLGFERYQKAAIDTAHRAVERLDELLPCDPTDMGERACAMAFIAEFGPRAYRRPLTADELQGLEEIYDGTMVVDPDAALAEKLAVVIERLLASPNFLYRPVLGGSRRALADEEVVPLDPWELASRLSYMLWASLPDKTLMAAAQSGELSQRDELLVQARRMMKDARFEATIDSFHVQWLRLDGISQVDKDPKFYPEFNEKLRSQMLEETQRFVRHVLLEGDASLDTLFTANFSFVTPELAEIYGVEHPGPDASGSPWARVELPPTQRSGVLTHAGVLATASQPNQSSPVQRGVMIRENLMCDTIPPPPVGVDDLPPQPDESSTTRERYAIHTSKGTCAGCHKYMDPLGFGLENFDGLGRWRDTDNKKPVDATGDIRAIGAEDTTKIDGPIELSRELAASDAVRGCVSGLWIEYALGRPVGRADACSQSAVLDQFAAANYDIRELVIAVVGSDSFRHVSIEGAL